MNVNLAEFLTEYCPEIPESVRSGEVYKITYSADLENISFLARFENFVPAEDVFAFEKTAAQALKVDKLRLHCRYEEKVFGLPVMT